MEAIQQKSGHGHHDEGIFLKYMWSTDHKIIGLQYLWTALLMAVVGGFFAFLFRTQLAFPGEAVPLYGTMSALQYNTLVTNHGAIMIFWVGMPGLLAAFGNLLIPLMIGADDMVFPRLNRLSYQLFLLSALMLLLSFWVPQGGFNGAWTAYPPLSTKTGPMGTGEWGGTLFLLAVAVEFAAFLMGGINFLTTTMNARTKGLGLWDLPITIWMINIASVVFMLSVGPLVAGALMLLADRVVGTGFYDPASGGDPVLFQHLFWFFGHPEVYVLFLPAFGLIGDVIAVHARKQLFAYKAIVWSTIITGVLSFIVWAHHQFIAGIDPRMATYFSIATIMISLPVAVMLFAYIATLYGGSIEFNVPMLFALGTLFEFLIGGVTGIHLASTGIDIYFHDNYFVVAHFHYTMFPTVILGMFAAIYHWYPKFAGRKMNNMLGQLHFWGTTIAFNMVFLPQFLTGFAGQHRRIADYTVFPEIMGRTGDLRLVSTYSAYVLLAFQVFFVINFIMSYRKGEVAGDNPWNATTLEWACASPPPHGNFTKPVEVFRGPYEYGVEGAKEDFIMQNSKS